MGAQNPDRLAIYKDRFEKWSDNIIPSFYYGSHYSTAAAVLTWLFRIEPYTTGFVEMQGGMFDSNDRIFSSIAQSWQSCLDDLNNVKEIIPEFFYLPEMFINLNKLSFGEANDGTVLGDVVLPPWCSGPEDFVRKHRMALESELVSCQLHNWIDLIFGYKQRGPASIKADNVFYYLTYLEDIPQLSSFDDHVLAKSIATQIKTFGRTPAQLLFEPHPPRNSIIKASPSIYEPAEENMCVVLNLQSQSPIVFLSTYNTGAFPLNSNQLSRGFPASNSYIITISKRFEFACNSYDYINKSSSNVLPVQPDKVICNTRAQRKYLGYSFVPELCVNYDRFAVSPNNEIIIATGYWDKTFRLIHSATSDLRQVIFGHFDIVTCVTIGLTHASYMLATGSKDRTVLTWLFDRKRCLVIDRNRKDQDVNPSPYSILYGHKDTVISVKLSGSGHGLIYSLSMPDKKLTVLQHDLNGNCLRLMFDHDQMSVSKIALMDVAMGGTDDLLIGYNNCIYLITVNGKQLNKLEVPNKQITVLAFDQSGEFVILGCKTGHVLVYSTNGFNLLRQYPRCDAEISALAVTENKRHIVAGLSNGRLVLLNVNFNTLLV
ncbi:hypothetical protein GJ496_002107 [Pomphorhynchus laevis]|nr:hypothetical protein GJ496_002107 [Pomphorhynchus laevis]